jgi:hypothetical protein
MLRPITDAADRAALMRDQPCQKTREAVTHNSSSVLTSQSTNELGVADALLQRQAFHLTVVDQTQSAIR